METLPGCCFVHCTQASTMARAVSALMAILFRVFLAASLDSVTLASVAGGPTCAHALGATRGITIAKTIRFIMSFLLYLRPIVAAGSNSDKSVKCGTIGENELRAIASPSGRGRCDSHAKREPDRAKP